MSKRKRRKRKKEKQVETKTPSRTQTNVATDYKLIIPDDIYQKIHHWLNKSSNEVSGFGSLEYNAKENSFTVKDVKLLKQKVAPTSTEIDPHAIGKMMFEMKDEPLGMKWHWHTHPNMGVFWSSDDMEVIRSLGQQGWILASVFNEKGEIKSAFYTTSQVNGPDGPKAHDIFHDNIKTEVLRFLPKEFFEALDKEYDLLVSKEEPFRGTWTGHLGYLDGPEDYNSYYHPQKDPEPIVQEIPDKRWAPEAKLEFNNWGYAELNGRYIYNPIHDEDLETEEAKMMTILSEMDPEEINFLRRQDTEFAKLYNKVLTHDAETHGQFFQEGVEV